MAWVTPRTWVADLLVTHTVLNVDIRDNLNALKAPPSANYEVNEGANYTTSSTSFADVDATNLALTIVTTGGDIFVSVVCTIDHSSSSGRAYLELDLDGVVQGGDDGICMVEYGTTVVAKVLSFVYLISGPSAASHTIKLQWKTTGATATMYAGAGTANFDVHPQMWAREVT